MNLAFYAGATALRAFQEKLNVTGNNLANSNTAGYKPTKSSFENLLYANMYVNTENEPMQGVGVRSMDAGLDMNQGSMRQTGWDLDFAIAGDGFFAVERNGVTRYTRDGQFQQVSENGKYYLGMSDGSFVLDSKGQHIAIPEKAKTTNKKNDKDKEVKANPTIGAQVAEKIGVYRFENPENLLAVSSNQFMETPQSGAPTVASTKTDYQLLQGTVELSRASVADEMTDLIIAQRGFQFGSKVVQAADEVEDIVNNLRK